MNENYQALESAITSATLSGAYKMELRHNPSGLPSAWLALEDKDDISEALEQLRAISTRMATMTVYRPNADIEPDTHEVAYHMVLGGMPVTVTVVLKKVDCLPSAAKHFPNLDWEERELMELTGIEVAGHPSPRRLLLDESIEAGIFDRLVPYSEMTNAANQDVLWNRIRQDTGAAEQRRQETPDTFDRRTK